MKKLVLNIVVLTLCILSVNVFAQTSTEYSVVDYRIAKGFIHAFQAQSEGGSNTEVRGLSLNAGLTAAIENAQFQDQYKVNGEFYGTRISYGLKADRKVAVVLPVDGQGRISEPRDHQAVYVVDLPTGFTDPCPPHCD